jgi:hypothetical protein
VTGRVRWFSRRSLLLHLAVLVWVPGCAVAAWWQVTIAMAGNALGWLYAVEWPVFAVLGVLGWWQLVHDDPAEVAKRRLARRRKPSGASPPAASEGAVGEPGTGEPGTGEPSAAGERPQGAPALSPGNVAAIVAAEDRDEELAAYNAYLASLAVTGRRKTWRDPTGERTEGRA